MADELSDVQRRGEEQRTLMEKKSEELEKQVMDLTSDLSKVNNDLRDSSANYYALKRSRRNWNPATALSR